MTKQCQTLLERFSTNIHMLQSNQLKILSEIKKMAVNELYLPSRNAQKAMNAEDYASYNSTDWAKLRKIWGLFPANVNMNSYAHDLLNKTIEQRNEKANTRPAEEVHDEKKTSTELTVEDLEICKKVIPPSQYQLHP